MGLREGVRGVLGTLCLVVCAQWKWGEICPQHTLCAPWAPWTQATCLLSVGTCACPGPSRPVSSLSSLSLLSSLLLPSSFPQSSLRPAHTSLPPPASPWRRAPFLQLPSPRLLAALDHSSPGRTSCFQSVFSLPLVIPNTPAAILSPSDLQDRGFCSLAPPLPCLLQQMLNEDPFAGHGPN